MLELTLIKYNSNCANNKVKSDESTDDENIPIAVLITVFILYFFILTWAILRALICSSPTPDSRALHLLFCFISPTLYLFCTYLVPGFCPV